MRLKFALVWLLLLAMGTAPLSPLPEVFGAALAAQDTGDGDDDDNDDDGDDDDVDDPDEVDPSDDDVGGDDPSGEEPGENDPTEDDLGQDEPGEDDLGDDSASDDPGGDDDIGGDDVGGDDIGGDDLSGDDAKDDSGDDAGDDDGAAGDDSGDDDDSATGDDDDGAAAGGNDDDDDMSSATGDDDDDGSDDIDDADDITDDRGDIDDDADDADQEPAQWEVAGGESEATRAERDNRDRIDTDGEGFRYRRGEFIALDLTADDLAELEAGGFEIVSRERLDALTGTLLLLRGPARLTDEAALDTLEALTDPDSIGYNHLFDSSSVQTSRKRGAAVPARQACGCDIGLIDTGVATSLAYFKHVTLVQRAFNGKSPQPQLHGTVVAHLLAGTTRNAGRATKIYVADIFGGARETAGSSFALIKALDWLAAQGVPVINISLSGPRNPAVASAIQRITGKGHTIVAAAGNDGPAAPPVFPGAYSGVIAVTAVDRVDRIYRYANRGKHVDFSARGVGVNAIDAKGQVREATGTSFAAPIIAARLAAQLRSPDAAAAQKAIRALEAEARDLGEPGRDPVYGVGLIGRNN